ncbi:MAG: DUF2779 domain-containing protein [Legionella sp.]|uniref:DUF2779 domain-containing protein n=1 Tax=Legionella sp. TaxID=459 RepID=UPI00283DDE43|nr:DUF2779 domain-containing protein [Legionella sp.]
MPKEPYTLSKSRFIRGLQCYKSLWLYTHQRDLRKISKSTLASFQQGDNVGEKAREIFPDGEFIPFDGVSFEEQISRTQKALKTAKVIYEAAFSYGGVFVKADIMRKVARGWELYEVKASCKVTDVFLDDIAVQYYVISGSGVSISKAFITIINNEYVRKGALDTKSLFISENVTADVKEMQAEIKKEIGKQQKVLIGKVPKIDIGPYCNDPYSCDFRGHCWKDIPKNSVFELAGKGINPFELYKKGIVNMADIPLEKLKGAQLEQVELFLRQGTVVSRPKLKKFLDDIWYPLYYLDFETFQMAVPPYDGLKPYQQVPFQYSLHFQKRRGGKLYHKEFLAKPNCDPRKELLSSLLEEIPKDACVLAYWKSFEESRLNELAQQFPRRAKQIKSITENMRDLWAPFKQRALYSWEQQGSHSIKNVLPAFVKDMRYEGMEISNGGDAMQAYHEMCAVADDPKALNEIRKNLLEYCCQDTLAMVRLLEVVHKRASK